MSRVVSLRLKDHQVERLQRAARRFGRTVSETAALLLEESLRQQDFPFIELRDSAAGRQAYIKLTRLAVWHIVWLTRDLGGDPAKTAGYLEIPEVQVRGALAYAEAYPEEVEAAIADNEWAEEHIKELLPGVRIVTFDASAS